MYLAEEITSETHQFHHSRKKPPRSKTKPKPTHRQGPLFADMLHETTDDQRIRAHHVCGSTTVYNRKGGLRLYCGRRDCPVCFKRRYRKIASKLRAYKKKTGNKLYWHRIDSDSHAKAMRAIRKANGDYACFPVINKWGTSQEIIISNIPANAPGGQRVCTDHPRLEAVLAVWTKTPEGRKVSFSSGFKIKDLSPDVEKSPNFFARISVDKIVPYAKAVGGVIENRTKSYIKWHNVDPEELTILLVKDDIVAYQIVMTEVLFQKERDAEDAMAQTTEYNAIPLGKKGKVIAPPVKLRQLLNNSIGTALQNDLLVTPLLSETEAQATSPPPR